MKRDMDLVRKILRACEDSPDGHVGHISIEGYSEQKIGFHATLMIEAGLVAGADVTACGDDGPQSIITRLTWEGYEFLDASRSDTLWEKAKSTAAAGGGVSLGILKGVLTRWGPRRL